MATEQPKTLGELRAMCWHNFVGNLADNMMDVNWMLVVTLFPVMVVTDRGNQGIYKKSRRSVEWWS